MRTLTRPMFNMGGPIKQGVMHGIREPYAGGGLSNQFNTGLVGDERYPKTSGREHHAIMAAPLAYAGGINALRWLGTLGVRQGLKKVAQKSAGQTFKNIGTTYGNVGKVSIGGAGAGTGTAAAAPVYTGMKGWLARDPLIKSALWAKRALMSPTSKGWGKSALRALTSPTSIALTAGYYLWPDGSKRKTPPPNGKVAGPMDYLQPGYGSVKEKEVKELSDAEKKAFANKQRTERVEKYLKLMGYDRSKKTAIADALIDASKIVGERGTLDLKNITGELINPIIQATSKRLDKPDQIREAVGLMATKAEIEKDLSAETDALAKTLKTEQIKGLQREAEKDTIGGDIRAYNTKHGKLPTGTNLAQLVRLRGGEVAGVPNTTEVKKWMKSQNKDEIDYLTELTTTTQIDPGIYVVNNRILIVDESNTVQPYNY